MNKNIQIAFNVVFILAIGYLLIIQQSVTKQQEGAIVEVKEEVGGSKESPIQLRYVNSDTIWAKYDFVDELRKNLADKQEEYRFDLERKITAFQKEIADFQEKAATMSQFEGHQKQKQLMEKEQELGRLQEELSIKLMEMEDKMKRDLRNNILKYLEKYKEREIDIIFDYSTNSSVLMVEDSLDLTNEVLKGLNEMYQNNKKEKK